MQVFSVYDVVVGSYMNPVFLHTHGEAIRSFTESVNSNEHAFNKYPNDYALYYLGDFDVDDGIFKCKEPVLLGFGSEYIRVVPSRSPDVISELTS